MDYHKLPRDSDIYNDARLHGLRSNFPVFRSDFASILALFGTGDPNVICLIGVTICQRCLLLSRLEFADWKADYERAHWSHASAWLTPNMLVLNVANRRLNNFHLTRGPCDAIIDSAMILSRCTIMYLDLSHSVSRRITGCVFYQFC